MEPTNKRIGGNQLSMRFLLWEIKTDDDRLAKIQWILYKLFGIKPKQPCGYTKSQYGFYCRQPFDLEHCYVINSGDTHEIRCKCCNHIQMTSTKYIDPNDDDEWISR